MGISAKLSPVGKRETQPKSDRGGLPRFGRLPAVREDILKEEIFHAILTLERRRAERSKKPFILMLLDSRAVAKNLRDQAFIERLLRSSQMQLGKATSSVGMKRARFSPLYLPRSA